MCVEEWTSQPSTYDEADKVAPDGREPDQPDQKRQGCTAALCDHASDHDRRLARDKKTHEGARLEKGEPRHC